MWNTCGCLFNVVNSNNFPNDSFFCMRIQAPKLNTWKWRKQYGSWRFFQGIQYIPYKNSLIKFHQITLECRQRVIRNGKCSSQQRCSHTKDLNNKCQMDKIKMLHYIPTGQNCMSKSFSASIWKLFRWLAKLAQLFQHHSNNQKLFC